VIKKKESHFQSAHKVFFFFWGRFLCRLRLCSVWDEEEEFALLGRKKYMRKTNKPTQEQLLSMPLQEGMGVWHVCLWFMYVWEWLFHLCDVYMTLWVRDIWCSDDGYDVYVFESCVCGWQWLCHMLCVWYCDDAWSVWCLYESLSSWYSRDSFSVRYFIFRWRIMFMLFRRIRTHNTRTHTHTHTHSAEQHKHNATSEKIYMRITHQVYVI